MFILYLYRSHILRNYALLKLYFGCPRSQASSACRKQQSRRSARPQPVCSPPLLENGPQNIGILGLPSVLLSLRQPFNHREGHTPREGHGDQHGLSFLALYFSRRRLSSWWHGAGKLSPERQRRLWPYMGRLRTLPCVTHPSQRALTTLPPPTHPMQDQNWLSFSDHNFSKDWNQDPHQMGTADCKR